MTKASVLIISGCPAAGKSTLARQLADVSDLNLHLETDLFYEAKSTLIDPSLPGAREQNEDIVRQFSAVAASFAQNGYNVLLDGVVGPWMLPIVSIFLSSFRYAILHPPLPVVLARGKHRQEKQVPVAAIEKMHSEFALHRKGFETYYFEDTSSLGGMADIPLYTAESGVDT